MSEKKEKLQATRQRALAFIAAFAVAFALAFAAGTPAEAADGLCLTADARTALTGKGDRDKDGLSNCRERRIMATKPGNYDSDGDGVADGKEVEDNTDPLDPDSDDDGLDDGEEKDRCTRPDDDDTDDDGETDGEDDDPRDDLEDEIEGAIDEIVCPVGDGDGIISLLGIDIILTSATYYDDVDGCEAVAALVAGAESVHAEVLVVREGDVLIAVKVELDDEDGDGRPDDDSDDDGREDEIRGVVDSVTCPSDEVDGELVVDGLAVVLTVFTVYEHVDGCPGLADIVESGAPTFVEVELLFREDIAVATVVELEDELEEHDSE